MKPTFVIYGNCQGGVLAQATQFMPSITDQYDVVYLRSFDHPTEGVAEIDPEVMRRCGIFWRQLDESAPFIFEGERAKGLREITFPPVDLGVLWPFQTHDALLGPDAEYEYGMFPYGDRILMQVADEGLVGADGLGRADALYRERLLDLDRYLEMEFARLQRREQGATVRMAAYVLSSFKSQRLFWAYNHPTRPLLRTLTNRLIEATWPEARQAGHDLHRIGDRIFDGWDPLNNLQVPVQPSVAGHLGLTWWTPDLKHRFHADDVWLTSSEYARLYIDERVKRLASPAVE